MRCLLLVTLVLSLTACERRSPRARADASAAEPKQARHRVDAARRSAGREADVARGENETADGTAEIEPAPPDLSPFDGPDGAYPWARRNARYEPLARRIRPPEGAERVDAEPGSYAHWLRHLPLRRAGSRVAAHDGDTILDGDDPRLTAVVDLDLVPGDLQQCADTVLRLRAEYLRAKGEADRIAFDYVSGFRSRWTDYRRGVRPKLVDDGRRIVPVRRATPDGSRETFMEYLRDLFSYASTVSLAREAAPVESVAIGDFFILPGGPGHTVLVVDLARGDDDELHALLAQGFMPAQDLHVLRAGPRSSWYRLEPGEAVDTPMWEPFPWSSLRRLE